VRVLGVFPAYEPAWAFGGVVRCTSNLFRAMADLGIDVSVYTTNCDGRNNRVKAPLGRVVDVGGVAVTYLPATFGTGSVWHSKALTKAIRDRVSDFDIVYISAVWQWIGISAGRVALESGVPYVVGTHGSFDSVLLKKSHVKKMLFWKLFLEKSFRGSEALHFTTEHERRQSERLKGVRPSFIVPNCISSEAFEIDRSLADVARREFNIPSNVPVVLNLGRPDPKKRLDVLLQSFELILQKYPGARLLIVGPDEGRYAEAMKRLAARTGISDNVIWAGYREGEDLKVCYAVADVLVLPSMDENFGMVVPEAMAAKVPVIISLFVGVADDIRRLDAGIIVDVDYEQIAAAAIDLLGQRDRLEAIREKARQAAQVLYSGPKVAKQMVKAFQDVISGTHSPGLKWQ